MNQPKQPSRPQSLLSSPVMLLLIGSILPSFILSTSVARSESTSAQIDRTKESVPAIKVVQADSTTTPSQPPVPEAAAQSSTLSDVSGNWAEPFIRVLVSRGIIKGYPDGTFKPNQLVTRAEFAALLNKAFSLQPTRAAKTFSDIPKNYWATAVIQKAYQGGFLSGYTDDSFAPNQNILRIESLVSLVNGNKLEPTEKIDLTDIFSDAAQIPSYGKNAIVAATQRCVAVGVDFDNTQIPGGNFKPNQGATRADVAALIHQVLVSTGKLSVLPKTDPAIKYIASCLDGTYYSVVTQTPPPPPVAATVPPPVVNNSSGSNPVTNFSAPVGGINSPSAFGANWGDVFAGASYQNNTRPAILSTPAGAPVGPQNTRDGGVGIGFGLGNALSFVGLEVVVISNSTVRRGFFDEGTINVKLHKQFGNNFAIAAGTDNALNFNFKTFSDVAPSYYGVTSLVLNPRGDLGFLSNTTVSLGVGNGRYTTIGDQRDDVDSWGIFGSIGTRLSPNFSLVADWDGADLGIGLPINISLSDRLGISIVPAIVDLVNPETGGRRFTLSGGIGYNF